MRHSRQLVIPGMPDVRPKVRLFRMRLTDAGDRYRAWKCRICDREEERHYDHEPPIRFAEPCPYCNDPDSPPARCRDCDVELPRRGPRRCPKCARKARAEVFRARWIAAHPSPPPIPLFPPGEEAPKSEVFPVEHLRGARA